ncbi:agmatine deiminase family protein [Pelagicoccus sp. SDUM812005]|uniref:agmatine deiminase family protein n=1 Tax=Pelagicoccus sp. SDUM812005 TaxID=3041257 RepID=UPI00280F5ED7|nr:agmatine deiminase family protein [Pelagicoccus sp. SDUM812005]MDQ8179019.1 agmatine deiminase family protein [Pelagicoccus sp. SDUM812005]
MKRLFPLRPLWRGSHLICCLAVSARAEVTDWPKAIDALHASLPGFFGIQTLPTKPLAVKRAIAEWEPLEALAVCLPIKESMDHPRILAYYSNLIGVASGYVDVVVLHRPQDERYVDLFSERLRKMEGVPAQLERVRFLQVQTGDFWARDFGPLFALGEDGRLLLLDNSDRPLMEEREAWQKVAMNAEGTDPEEDERDFESLSAWNRRREVTPMYVAKFVRQRYGVDCEVVRPPLHLQGGDYLTDGSGAVFVSEDTVLGNDGRLTYLRSVFRDYYGADRVHTLNALPGITVKHLDQLVKLVAPDTFLVAEPLEFSGQASSAHLRRLSQEVGEVLAANEAYLRKHFPAAKIVRLPMLPPVPEDAPNVTHRFRSQVFARVCEELGVSYLRYVKLSEGDSQKELVEKKVLEYLVNRFQRSIDFYDDEDLSFLTETYLGADLQVLLETNVDSSSAYRTYLNSVYLRTKDGREAWLLPRYLPQRGETEEAISDIERRVEAVYRSLFPESRIHWIEADVMSEMLGAIHCTTFTIPALPAE